MKYLIMIGEIYHPDKLNDISASKDCALESINLCKKVVNGSKLMYGQVLDLVNMEIIYSCESKANHKGYKFVEDTTIKQPDNWRWYD